MCSALFQSRSRYLAIALILAVTSSSCLYKFGPYTGDSPRYLRLAENLVAGHGFSAASTPPYFPEVFRGPAYPLFLALLLRLHLDVTGIVVVQLLLYLLAIVLAMDIARTVTNDTLAATMLGFLLAGYAPSVRWIGSITAESVCTVLFVLACWCLVRFLRCPTLLATLGLGASQAALFLTRAEYIVLVPLTLVLGAFVWRPGGLRYCLVLALILTAAGGAWMLRNLQVLPQTFRPLGLGAGMTLWIRSIELEEEDYERRTQRLNHADFLALHAGTDPEVQWRAEDNLRRDALEVIAAQLPAYCAGAAVKLLLREWVEVYNPGLPRMVLYFVAATSTTLLLLSYAGIIISWKHGVLVGPLVAMCFAVAVTHAFGGTEARYTVPLRPVLHVFAAAALCRLFRLGAQRTPVLSATAREQ